jgi:hypothetical protein
VDAKQGLARAGLGRVGLVYAAVAEVVAVDQEVGHVRMLSGQVIESAC